MKKLLALMLALALFIPAASMADTSKEMSDTLAYLAGISTDGLLFFKGMLTTLLMIKEKDNEAPTSISNTGLAKYLPDPTTFMNEAFDMNIAYDKSGFYNDDTLFFGRFLTTNPDDCPYCYGVILLGWGFTEIDDPSGLVLLKDNIKVTVGLSGDAMVVKAEVIDPAN